MKELFKLTSKIVPEFNELINRRYKILSTVRHNEPVGRRILANLTDLGERTIRNEVELLKKANFVIVNNNGVCITEEGIKVIEELKVLIRDIIGLTELEQKLKEILNVQKVIIVPGDSDNNKLVLNEMGKAASKYLSKILKDNTKVAITGGYSVKALVDKFENSSKYKNVLVLPARGGMGKIVEIQSNTLASDLAKKVNGTYKLLYAPDSLSDVALEAMLKEKGIKEIVEKIKNTDILIYGIGRAQDMAERRDLNEDIKRELIKKQAVGEAFGIYFDNKGNNIYSTPTIGINYDDLEGINKLIAIAGGKSKSEAVLAVQKNRKAGILITDQGCAEQIMNIFLRNEEN